MVNVAVVVVEIVDELDTETVIDPPGPSLNDVPGAAIRN
jgi:hypothetical protein